MTPNNTLDNEFIKDQIEAGEVVTFSKPTYAQAWFIAIPWLLIALAIYGYLFAQGKYIPALLLLAVVLLLYACYKFFTGIRRVELSGDSVRVYGLNSQPIKELQLSRLSAMIDSEEIYLIKKAQFTGGVTLRKAYWGNQWPDMKAQFRFRSAYANSGDNAKAGLGGTPSLAGSRANASPTATLALIYDIALSPYLSICKSIAGGK